MKRCFALLLAAVVLLGGCSADRAVDPSTATPMEPTQPPTKPTEPPFAVYEDTHSVEVLTHGAVKRYALEGEAYTAMVPMGDGVLFFSGESDTTLTYLSADQKPISVTVSGNIRPDSAAFWATEQGVSYYNADGHTLVFLDTGLQEISRISLPEAMDCLPVLSQDWQWVYYYTADSLRCLELRSGISRLLKESRFSTQQVNRICFEGSVLECYISDGSLGKTLFISTETGKTLFETEGKLTLNADGKYFFTRWKESDQQFLLFGQKDQTVQRLTAAKDGEFIPMLHNDLIVSVHADRTGTGLIGYDLTSDQQISQVRLAGIGAPVGMVAAKDGIWFLARDFWTDSQALYFWDLSVAPQSLEQSYLSPYYTATSPDTDGLKQCEQKADILAATYGVRIKLWKDAVAQAPKNYSLTEEYIVAVYENYLPVLEKALGAFPKEVFRRLGKQSKNGKLTISLVREVYGTTELGSQTLEQGVHFWDNGSSYLVLMMNDKLEQSFYHELFHAMDSYILTETKVFDDWRKLNPSGFAYDYSYITNEFRDTKDYLEPQKRAFIDIYSMSYPKEDRARIIEYAMLEGNEAYFTSKTMRNKLRTICKGINRAFGLSEGEQFLWEQYL